MNRSEAQRRAAHIRDVIVDRVNAAGDDYPAVAVVDRRPDVVAFDVADAAADAGDAGDAADVPWTWRVAVEIHPYRRVAR